MPAIHEKRKKIYYVPGLISLVFLPLLFFKKVHNSSKPLVAMNYNVPSNISNKYTFSGKGFLTYFHKKRFISYDLDGDHELNKIRFEFINNEVLHLKFTTDTSTVIAIHLDKSLRYDDFVYLLDMMVIDDQAHYHEWNNVFYIYNFPPVINRSYQQQYVPLFE